MWQTVIGRGSGFIAEAATKLWRNPVHGELLIH